MMEAATGWTDERVALLARLWSEGLSASQIAATLGGGVTRNAVIGKVHRLGLAGRTKTGQPAPRQNPTAAPKARPATMANEAPATLRAVGDEPGEAPRLPAAAAEREVAIPVSERVTILDLRDAMCRWPLGDPTSADFGFCGGRTVSGLPYCSHHCRIAYQPAAERRRVRAF